MLEREPVSNLLQSQATSLLKVQALLERGEAERAQREAERALRTLQYAAELLGMELPPSVVEDAERELDDG